jgi:TolB-like protein/class 3 adenylate cyclase/tetratricopeptide (TPR) repeat protein
MKETRLQRKLSALISADVVGYSRLMADDELDTVRNLTACRERVTEVIEQGGGRLVDFVGDNMLAEYPNTLDAVNCAKQIHQRLADLNTNLSENRHINFRMGIHIGDIMSDGQRLYGDVVNIAARLQALAEPGGICISDVVYQQIHGKLQYHYLDLGKKSLKNLPDPVRVFRILDYEEGHHRIKPSEIATRQPSMPLPAKPSLAVLPFVNLGGNYKTDHFTDGLTLDVMTGLVQIPGLLLISDVSMFTYRSNPTTMQEIGRQLGVSHVLDGGVRKNSDQIRISARLTDIVKNRQVWAQRFDRRLDDVFAIQDEITREIVTAMDVALVSGEPARTVRKALNIPAAIESFYRGWGALFSSAAEDIRLAQEMFEETIHLEPKSSIGYALAALAYLQQTSQHADTQSVHLLNRARELAEQALALEDVTGLADLVLAHVYLREKKHEKALAAAERTVLARPSCDAAFAVKAEVLNYLGKSTEAIGLAKFAMRLAPVYPSYYPAVLSAAYYGSSRFQEALDAAEVSFEADPNNLDALLLMVAANSSLGRYDQAQKAVNNLRSIRPEFTTDTFATNHPYKDLKSLEKMVSLLKQAGL